MRSDVERTADGRTEDETGVERTADGSDGGRNGSRTDGGQSWREEDGRTTKRESGVTAADALTEDGGGSAAGGRRGEAEVEACQVEEKGTGREGGEGRVGGLPRYPLPPTESYGISKKVFDFVLIFEMPRVFPCPPPLRAYPADPPPHPSATHPQASLHSPPSLHLCRPPVPLSP